MIWFTTIVEGFVSVVCKPTNGNKSIPVFKEVWLELLWPADAVVADAGVVAVIGNVYCVYVFPSLDNIDDENVEQLVKHAENFIKENDELINEICRYLILAHVKRHRGKIGV